MITALLTIALIISLILNRILRDGIKTFQRLFDAEYLKVLKLEDEISELHEKIAKIPKCGRPKKTKI